MTLFTRNKLITAAVVIFATSLVGYFASGLLRTDTVYAVEDVCSRYPETEGCGSGGTTPTNQPPSVLFRSPDLSDSFTAPASILISVSASDSDGIRDVKFYNGDTLLATDTTPDSNGRYTYTWDDVSVGAYTITVRATDTRLAWKEVTRDLTVTRPESDAFVDVTLRTNPSGQRIYWTLRVSDPDYGLVPVSGSAQSAGNSDRHVVKYPPSGGAVVTVDEIITPAGYSATFSTDEEGEDFVIARENYTQNFYINVTRDDPVAPEPQPIPSPSVDIKVNGSEAPLTLPAPFDASISWSAQNVERCYGSWTSDSLIQSGVFQGSGNGLEEGVTQATTYRISCQGQDGSWVSDEVEVNVTKTDATVLDPTSRPIVTLYAQSDAQGERLQVTNDRSGKLYDPTDFVSTSTRYKVFEDRIPSGDSDILVSLAPSQNAGAPVVSLNGSRLASLDGVMLPAGEHEVMLNYSPETPSCSTHTVHTFFNGNANGPVTVVKSNNNDIGDFEWGTSGNTSAVDKVVVDIDSNNPHDFYEGEYNSPVGGSDVQLLPAAGTTMTFNVTTYDSSNVALCTDSLVVNVVSPGQCSATALVNGAKSVTVNQGDSVKFEWSAGGDVDSVEINAPSPWGNQTVTTPPFSGSESYSSLAPGSYTFEVNCENSLGGSTDEAYVTVNSTQPPTQSCQVNTSLNPSIAQFNEPVSFGWRVMDGGGQLEIQSSMGWANDSVSRVSEDDTGALFGVAPSIAGTYDIIATCTADNGNPYTVTERLTVQAPSFEMDLNPNPVIFRKLSGEQEEVVVRLTPESGFAGDDVRLSVDQSSLGQLSGKISTSFDDAIIEGGNGSATLTVVHDERAPRGTYSIKVIGTNLTTNVRESATLTIQLLNLANTDTVEI